MATLITNRYVKPGAYIGQIVRPRPTELTGTPRIPCYVGAGDRLALGRNLAIRRSYVFEEQVALSAAPPHIALLQYRADGDQTTSRLYKSNGREISRTKWSYFQSVDPADSILLDVTEYSSTETYYLDYQSIERSPKDPLPIDEIREIIQVSKTPDQEQYLEFTDFFIEVDVTDPVTDTNNNYLETRWGPFDQYGGTGTLLTTPVAYVGDGTAGTPVEMGPDCGGLAPQFDTALQFTPILGAGQTLIDLEGIEIVFVDALVGKAGTIAEAPAGGPNGNGLITITYDSVAGTQALDISALFPTALIPMTCTFVDPDAGVPLGAGIWPAAAPGDIQTVTSSFTPTTGNAGRGHIPFLSVSMSYGHDYTRHYVTEVETAVAGNFTNDDMVYTASPEWVTYSGGEDVGIRSPAHSIMDLDVLNALANSFTLAGIAVDWDANVGGGTPGLATPTYGMVVEYYSGGANGTTAVVAGDNWYIDMIGPGLLEKDGRYDNTNQYVEKGIITTSGPTVLVTHDDETTYDGDYNRSYVAICTSIAAPLETWNWCSIGDDGMVNGADTVDQSATQPVTLNFDENVDIDIDLTAGNSAIGDFFYFDVAAPRLLSTAKDDRDYDCQVTSAAAANVAFFYSTNTIEGRFGTFTATTTTPVELPDSVFIAVRNVGDAAVPTSYDVSAPDTFTWSLANEDVLDWSLQNQVEETTDSSDIIHDVLGTITGTPNTYYLLLQYTPNDVNSILSVVDSSSVPVAYTLLLDVNGNPTNVLWFATNPNDDITVVYRHLGAEPDPGDLYYFTAYYLRSDDLYDVPVMSITIDDARDLLRPNSTDNHLYNMAVTAFANNPFAIYTVQVKDADFDGFYNNADFKRGIDATEGKADISDVIVLSHFDTLSYQLASIDQMNDPFERKERLTWIGAPIGTPIGDATTADSLVYLAKNTLQVFGNSPAHGTRILLAPTECDMEIVLPDSSTTTVTYDGSFVAGATAALVSSFTDPGDTILRKNLTGFTDLQTYTEQEDLILGAANVTYIEDVGSGVFRFGESITVDTFAPDFNEISAMTQKQYVTRIIRAAVDSSLVSVIPPSEEAGIGIIQGFIVAQLLGLLSRGLIGAYQDIDGNSRKIDPGTDVVVFRDATSPTLWHFNYAYWIRYPIKRLYGLYTVDTNDFGTA
jgi:hypothetical protein